jgi:transposase-like protein
MKTPNPAVARVLKRLHYPIDVISTCVRWYVAYPLSLRNLEEIMAEREIAGGHFDRPPVGHQASAAA